MSGGTVCKCNPRDAQWEVWQRKCNHSAFNGGRYTPSAWSSVHCVTCGALWRTKAAYVNALPDKE